MKTIRDYLNLLEAPLEDYKTYGDFSQDGSFQDKDRQLLSKPKHQARLKKLLAKTGHSFRIYPLNLSHDELRDKKIMRSIEIKNKDQHETIDQDTINQYIGEYSSIDEVNKTFGLDLRDDPSSITFVLAMNNNGDHALSAWMIMHRFVHALEDGGLNSWSKGTAHELSPHLKSVVANFQKLIGETARIIYDNSSLKSVKNGKMENTEELPAELLVQYLVKGKIDVHGFDDLERRLEQLAELILDMCKGKIFVGL